VQSKAKGCEDRLTGGLARLLLPEEKMNIFSCYNQDVMNLNDHQTVAIVEKPPPKKLRSNCCLLFRAGKESVLSFFLLKLGNLLSKE
jgi:hypothetical protein